MRILGIDFGAWSIKAVEMESRFRRLDFLDFHEVRLPLEILDPVETYRTTYQQLIARLPSHPEKIVTSLLPSQTAIRFLTIPTKKRKQVEKMYRFQLEDSIPFKMEDTIVEHHVSKVPEGSLVLAAIAPKKLVLHQIDWLKNLGVDPDWLIFDGMGVTNLFLAGESLKQDETERADSPTLLLDLGHQKTTLSVFHESRLEFIRSIPWGGAAISRAIAISSGVSLEEAEQIKMTDLRLNPEDTKNAGETTREFHEAAVNSFSQLLADINHSMVGYRNLYKREIQAIRLIGGTAKVDGIEDYFESRFKIPVSLFRPFSTLSVKESLRQADELRFAEAVGRSMVFGRKSPLLFNFRQQDVGKGTSLKEITELLQNPNILKALSLGGLLTLVLFIHVFIGGYVADRESKLATDELRKVFAQAFPAVPKKLQTSLTASPKELRKYIQQKNNELDQKLKTINRGSTPMLAVIRNISDSFPDDVKVDVNVLQVDDRTFHFDGVLYSGDINHVTDALKKITQFSNVELKLEEKRPEGQRFSYKGMITGR